MFRKHSLSLFTLALAGILGWSLTLSHYKEPGYAGFVFAWAVLVIVIFLVHRDVGWFMFYGTSCGFAWDLLPEIIQIKFSSPEIAFVKMVIGTSLGLVAGFFYYKVLPQDQAAAALTGTQNPPGASA